MIFPRISANVSINEALMRTGCNNKRLFPLSYFPIKHSGVRGFHPATVWPRHSSPTAGPLFVFSKEREACIREFLRHLGIRFSFKVDALSFAQSGNYHGGICQMRCTMLLKLISEFPQSMDPVNSNFLV